MLQFVMKLLFIITLIFSYTLMAYAEMPTIYLISGQGADCRLYEKLQIDSTYEVKCIEYFTPEKDWLMNDFAKALSSQIDTTESFILIGVSLGGMLACEMTSFLAPQQTILISSAKNKYELPSHYRFMHTIPIYKAVPKNTIKGGALFAQSIFEPISKTDSIFHSMLAAKDPAFLKRTIHMIMQWDREISPNNVIHIHGNNDHTIPAKNVDYDYLIQEGSHMMVRTKAKEISTLIHDILSSQNSTRIP